ncbi:TonB-dependent receptor [Prevotella sp. E15-22]|uniref:carboxypeptidase-like regulatory domain-containing protein n=1 Tax=Prevotella sp. E15-22 TaxID=2937774 RepID=UPI00204605EF|nr:carboxypeptidase-like regulatory domain-containing protein [Prevotella sp. E15-22]UPS44485.1 TonB-dependent receptor [Prevotella sp. E15-22]
MRRFISLIILLSLTLMASAQVQVKGRVINLQNKPVSDVIVKLVKGSKTLAFTTTNVRGEYTMSLKETPSGETQLQFSHVSYEKESEKLELNSKVKTVDMVLTPKTISLKEVKIKGNPLRQRGDTLVHNLASFLGKGDVTLEDGLKRLPGVDVATSGAISYMGKPISQFNIEGLDLLGGRYNLATRNLPADYVTQVEIVRNHHGRKMDKDKPSDEVSMNIKLNKKAKFKPFGQEEAGAGYMQDGDDRLQALLGVTGMMFTDNFQTICSAKAGNYKSFAKADLYDHYGSSEVSTRATGLFGGFDGGRPPQGEYLYQRNAMGTINTINKLDSVTTFKVNADYSYQRVTHDIGQSSTYLTGDGSYVTVTEQTSPLTKIHLPKLSMNYQKNADRSYLDETFVVKGKFEQNEGDVLANQQQIEQRRKASSFEVVDNVYWSSRSLKGAYRYLNGGISFKRTPMLRLSFYDNGKAYGQTAQSSTLSMNLGSSFDIPIGKTFKINLPVSVSAAYDDLETVYSPPSQGGAGGGSGSINDIRGWSVNPSLNPGFEIHSRNRRFYLSTGLGASLKGLYYNKLHYTKPVINPSLSMSYTFSANSKLSFSSNYSTSIGDMMTLLTNPMQVGYRTERTSSGIIGESNNWNTSGSWKWQLPMQYFTLSLGAGHSETKHNTLYSQSVSGIDISSSALQRDTRSRSTSFNFATTKNIPTLFAKFSLDGSYGFGSGEQAVNGEVFKTKSSNYSIHSNVALTPLSWLELKYDINYGWSQSRYADNKNDVTSLTHSGAIHVFLIAVLDISLDYDHVRRQITTNQYKNMSLFNASAQYKLKKAVLRLELTNLLNQRSYAYTVYDGVNTYSYDYGLCGRTALFKATFKI